MPAPARVSALQAEAEGVITGEGIPAAHGEGKVKGLAYRTDIASSAGCSLHIWMAFHSGNKSALREAVKIASANRDVVQVTYSGGSPTGFHSHQRMGWDT
jgi:hypothetical protein